MIAAMTLTYVDLETARASRETCLVVASAVPSPWSEAAKGCLRVARVPALVVRRNRDAAAAIDAWTGIDNVPALRHGGDPVRTSWSAIVAFVDRAARTAGTPRLLPDEPRARASVMGVLHEIAGEDGVGWNARLAMIDAGLTSSGARGFPMPVASFLAARYGYVPGQLEATRTRLAAQLDFLADTLRAAGGDYVGGGAPNAVDIYLATFLTPLVAAISEAECPAMSPLLRAAFATAHETFGELVPPALASHRERMFAAHLERPITL